MNSKTLKKRKKEIEEEISWYEPPKSIANAMIKLVDCGFEFSGHGFGGGVEGFSLIKDIYYISIDDYGNKKTCTIIKNIEDDDSEIIFEGTIGKMLKYVQKFIS